MDRELLMSLYERIDKELYEMHERLYEEKYEPTRDPYWEGVLHGMDNAMRIVERAFKEAASGQV